MTPTQGGASLTLGFDIEPRWGSRVRPRRNPEMDGWPHIDGHAGDADLVSTVCGAGDGVAFVERPETTGGAPLMAVPLRYEPQILHKPIAEPTTKEET